MTLISASGSSSKIRVKGIADPVKSYTVVGLNQNGAIEGAAHLRLELDADSMSDEERRAAAEVLRRALGQLEKGSS
jgi:hypothetical protein